MDTTTYVITLNHDITKSDIFDILSRDTSTDVSVDSNKIPDRAIELSYEQKRLFNERVFEIDLTPKDLEILRNNSDIVGIEYPAIWDDNWSDAAYSQDLKLQRIGLTSLEAIDGTWDNWGLWRHSQASNDWFHQNDGSPAQNEERNVTYDYDYAGEGVDVVIQEGYQIQWDLPEFEDGTTGNTRLVKYQWNRHFPRDPADEPATETSPGDPDSSYFDPAGSSQAEVDAGTSKWLFADINYDSPTVSSHKTHCASNAVGTRYGWAKKAKIYDLPYSLIGSAYAFDAIKLFHLDKGSVDQPGYRPTVVSASWGKKLYTYYGTTTAPQQTVTSVYFRGKHFKKFSEFVRGDENPNNIGNLEQCPILEFKTGEPLYQDGRPRQPPTVRNGSDLQKYGFVGNLTTPAGYGYPPSTYGLFNYSSPSEMAEVEELTAAGVCYVKSAGNQRHKIDLWDGIDYDNYVTLTLDSPNSGYVAGSPAFYNRGSGNISHDTIVVGALGGTMWTASGAGQIGNNGETEQKSAYTEKGPRVDTFAAGDHIQGVSITGGASKLSGTSFSCPQVAGMAACLYEKYPLMKPSQVRKYFREVAVSDTPLNDAEKWGPNIGFSNSDPSTDPVTSDGDILYFAMTYSLWNALPNIVKFIPTDAGLTEDPTLYTDVIPGAGQWQNANNFTGPTNPPITEYDFSDMETTYRAKYDYGDLVYKFAPTHNFRYYKFTAYIDKNFTMPFEQDGPAGFAPYNWDYETKRIPQIELYDSFGVNYLEGGMSSSPDTSGFTPSNPTGYVYYTETINGHDVTVGADFDRTEGVGPDAGKYIYSPSAIFDQDQSYGFLARTGTDIEFTIDLGRAVHLHAARIIDDGTGFRVPPYIDIYGSTDGTNWNTKVGEFNRADLFISGDGIGQNFQEGIGPHGDTTAANSYSTATMLSVNFSSESIGENLTYFWDFGNGNTSTLQNPSHTYAEPGVYIVTLTVTDALEVSDTVTQTVTIMAPVTASESSGYSPNLYVNLFDNSPEQRLIEDLIIESIKFYGRDLYYIPRKQSGSFDQLYGEDPRKTFVDAYLIEMYIKNVEGFEGEGDLMGRFGLEIRDQTTLTVSIRRFGELILGNPGLSALGITRPREGDLIFMDFVRPDTKYSGKAGMFFEIQFVEHEAIFYQTGSLQTYDLRCETFTYSNETFATGVDVIDAAFANGVSSYVTTGNTMPDSTTADNEIIEREAESILDLSETSPFGDFG